MHVIAPVYFVAAKCRHPIVRRAALDLLLRIPTRRENLWRASVMAAIAKRTIRLEEEHLQLPRAETVSQSRPHSPPELSTSLGDAWDSGPSRAPLPDRCSIKAVSRPPFDCSDAAAHAPRPSPCSSSPAATASVDMAGTDDLAGTPAAASMPIDPALSWNANHRGGLDGALLQQYPAVHRLVARRQARYRCCCCPADMYTSLWRRRRQLPGRRFLLLASGTGRHRAARSAYARGQCVLYHTSALAFASPLPLALTLAL
ncbi:hypothetical protein VTK56DRAFT_8291 [Thermocarpiscus australiensis]